MADKLQPGVDLVMDKHFPLFLQIKNNFSLTNKSTFTAEIIAVLKAQEMAYDNPPNKLTVLTDYLLLVLALKNKVCNRSDITEETC